MKVVDRSVSQPFLANNGVSYGPIMMTLNALLCVDTSFSIAARRSPSVYVANLTVMPGFCFSNTDWVSGIIWLVISGLDTMVSNPLITNQMIPLTQSVFEKQNPGITVKFATYTEGDLRAAIEKDVSTHSNAFNVIMIGPYETPLFAKNGWLTDLSTTFINSDPSYD